MEFVLVILGVIAFVVVARLFKSSNGSFDDPKPMSNEHLLSAIAGQADWIQKMHRAPMETQLSQSIKDLTIRRKNYIERLCSEVISRGEAESNIFNETNAYAKNLASTGIPSGVAGVRAVKEILFKANGVHYPASWEV